MLHELNLDEFDLAEIESIELVGESPSVDITVRDTHMFYANDIYTHNSGSTSGLIDLTHIHEAYSISFPTTLFITFTITDDDAKLGKGKFYIVKNRLGATGLLFEIAFKHEMSRIHVMKQIEHVTNTNVQFDDDEKRYASDILNKIRNKK